MAIILGTKMVQGKAVPVSVLVTSTLSFTKIDEKKIVATAVGETVLHKSTKVKGAPLGTIGYIHNSGENTLYAVSALDTSNHTITITKEGQAKNGVHVFK